MNTKQFRMFTIIQLVILSLVFLMPGCKDGGEKGYKVTLLQTTDMHARVAGVGPFNSYTPETLNDDTVLGGFARLAAKINEIRTAKTGEGAEVILIDSGDYSMGTVYDFLWKTDPASLRFIQEMDYDLITLGNHEFDYGPEKLAEMINASKAAAGGFDIPIVASNAVFDAADAGDDDLAALQTSGAIVTTYVKTLSSGVKIGFIGLMGASANTDSPNAGPVTFKYDYAGADKAYIQGIVDDLRNNQGVKAVIALSHSGLLLDTDPVSGDDIILAQNITGIDIIASGHDHEMTTEILEVANTATPSNITRIICAGEYTENLAQLDFTVSDSGTANLTLTNHTIDDSIAGDSEINDKVDAMNDAINIISPAGKDVDTKVAEISFDLLAPSTAVENGMGNLIADALRFAGTNKTIFQFTIGAFATGVIRDSFTISNNISFSDLFAVVPLGITTDSTQTSGYPGYPLMKVYLTGAEIKDVCRFNAKIIQLQSFAPTYISFFVHMSGVQYDYKDGVSSNVKICAAWNDYNSTGTFSAIVDGTLYPIIIDKYVVDMLLSDSVQALLTNTDLFTPALSIHLKDSFSNPITAVNMMDSRLDNSGSAGIQEYYAWTAMLDFFADKGYLSGIPADPYNTSTTTHKRIILLP